MTNRTFLALLLSAGLALPMLAQQTNSSASTPPASADQTAPATSAAQSQSAARESFWDGDDPSTLALILHPFASKAYVRRHIQTIQDRVNELDEITASNRKMIQDIDARARQGIQLASDKASLADEHAQEATNKAQMAHETAAAAADRVASIETHVGNLDQYKSGAQTEIRFRPGQTVLSKQAKDALDEMAAQVKNRHGYIVEVQGFSSGQGQAAIANSKMLADSVVRYLVLNHEIPAYRIYVIGMGNIPGANRTMGTRVEVNLLKNDLEQTAQR